MTLELEQRVDERTAQLRQLNLQLEARVQERTAELREANENLQHFAHMAAHDMRSPLRAINAFCSMVLEGETSRIDPESRSLLRRATQSAAQMQQLLDDLLEYSQLGEKQLNLEEVNLNDAVSNALALLDGDLRARNALLTVENTPRGVLGHPPTLILIISNFVSNALKFVAPGVQPQIRIWAEESDPSSALLMSPLKQFVRLYIQDNGIGIAPKDLGKIFEIFQRLHGKGAYPGTGLGLAIVRKGAERMGGKVGVESQPGQGSKFWIELPGTSGTNSSKV